MTIINKSFPLIIESYPEDYTGYKFITLLSYCDDTLLTIVDNHDKNNIYAYVLDYCNIENIDEALLIKLVNVWYMNGMTYPISVEFSKNDINLSCIYKTFNINYVKRIIGPLPIFEMNSIKTIKRKKRNIANTSYDIVYKPLSSLSV